MAKNGGSYPISSNSRTKLNAFRFNDRDENEKSPEKASSKVALTGGNGDKENQSSWLNGVAQSDQPGKGQSSTQTKEAKPVKECPQTPGNRIPLADLINNAEDAFSNVPAQVFTPEDHVIWQHVPASSNPDTMSQTPAARGKKRRHSSSPSSSPSKDAQKEPFDLQSIQTLLKTPQHDLATDLWNNYVGKSALDGTVDIPPPRFANLLSSSPQTPASAKAGRDSSGLRRSISCNAEWPTSKAKRRRVGGREGTSRAAFSRTKSNLLDSGKNKSSRINSLIERIEKSMQKGPTPAELSSPVPVSKDISRNRSASPIEKINQTDDNNVAPTDPVKKQEISLQGSSSEFEDDDLDQDFLDLVDASMDPFVEQTQPQSHSDHTKTETKPKISSNQSNYIWNGTNKTNSGAIAPNPNMNTVNVNDSNATDEFDNDFDDLPDNIENIIARCDGVTPTEDKPNKNESGFKQPVTATLQGAETRKGDNQPADASSGDEFDDDDFDLEAIEQSMLQPGEDGSNYNLKNRQAIKRYQVVDIAENTYVCPRGRVQPEQVLLVQDEKTKDKKVIVLRESWFDSPCSKDSYIHLIGDFDAAGQCIVTDADNMIILHPDHLISATVVADSISCQRRAVLQDRIKNSADVTRPQVFGIIFHEVFQEAMKANQWDLNSLRALVENILVKHLEDLYMIQMSVFEGVEYIMSKIPVLKAWAETFLRAKPTAESLVEDRNNSKLNLSITKLLEVEEHIWSPMYGLKGNIDATVQIACNDGEGDKNLVIPLELKTGNRDTNQAHRAQTALYTLLLSDRYDVDVTFGLLYYLEISKTLRIRGIRHELLQMIQERNRLSGYVRQRLQLPPMIKRAGMCNRCYSKTPCFIYHKLAEDGDGETSGLGDDFVKATTHLSSQHRDFFRKWDELLTKEELSMMRFRRELWTLLSHERESLGRCFGNVVIEPESAYEDKDSGTKINRYRYTFMKKQAPSSFSFAESQLSVGEPIVVSDEKGHFALANGYVTQVHPKRITVAVDRSLHNSRSKGAGFHAKYNQDFKGIMEVSDNKVSSTASLGEPEETVYRLDKDEFSNGMAIVRNNLIAMMDQDLFQAKQLRRLIVEREAPRFKPTSSAYTMSESDRASLNVDQKQAIDKVMSAKDYALVLGMPGTGKTTTIAHIIRALVAQGKSVLLTSYTHTAVDNILLKIRDDNFRIMRIGAAAKVHPDVQEFVDLAAIPKNNMEELKGMYEDSQIVATTCLGVNHGVFNQRIFDYCIVDEASQITLPVCLGPIRMARTFILVGDHYQLPPLVQNKEAQEGGLDVSLFKLLSDSHPDSVVNLEHQYRMCKDIMLLSNTLIYSGHLKCGTPQVASQSLELPSIGGLKKHHLPQSSDQRQLCLGKNQGRCWLSDLVDPSAKTRLVNTDTLATPALDEANGSRIVNVTEAKLCAQLVEAFISCGISAREIGVITFYRSQLSVLKQNLRHHLPDLEMHTADKFQGRDKEIVILSCVRSNSENNVGDLLRDWRRVNVAFTRARTKLLVVGSKGTLRDGNELLGKYVRLVENRGWIYDLPKNALENHHFEHESMGSTQPLNQSKDKSIISPKKSPSQSKTTRNPLSPVQAPNGLKKPAKRGAKILSGAKVIGNRPVLQDVVNDLIG